MSKYIDAEKLKSIIKAQIKERKEWMKDIDRSDRQDQLWSDLNGEDMSILQIIDSLQQEQNFAQDTELTYFESALFTAFSYAWQDYLRGEEVNVAQWAKENSAELLEAAKFQQEQQEVDLEEEIAIYLRTFSSSFGNGIEYAKNIARHFYELARQKYEK